MPDGAIPPVLPIPRIFYGLDQAPETRATLNALVRQVGSPGERHAQWYIADNLITYGHTAGFRFDPRFVSAVSAAGPKPAELSLAWRTHTLCWAAQSCAGLAGDFVECGTYEGYSMEVVLHYLGGLPGRQCWLYDLFDPSGAEGEGGRLPEHSPALFDRVRARFQPWPNVTVTRGKVPDVLHSVAPERIAFLHIDMNNMDAELGALSMLYDRLAVGGMIVFDDYGWTGYQDQKQAEDRFAAERGLTILELPT
ncbi:MAG: TylF/MycF/NovP-related O-methyltransferase, partial [Acetobacteraceae bacterium]